MSGRGPSQAPEESSFQKFKKSPAYIIGLNAALFVAGVAFIQSPLMDMMVPQL